MLRLEHFQPPFVKKQKWTTHNSDKTRWTDFWQTCWMTKFLKYSALCATDLNNKLQLYRLCCQYSSTVVRCSSLKRSYARNLTLEKQCLRRILWIPYLDHLSNIVIMRTMMAPFSATVWRYRLLCLGQVVHGPENEGHRRAQWVTINKPQRIGDLYYFA